MRELRVRLGLAATLLVHQMGKFGGRRQFVVRPNDALGSFAVAIGASSHIYSVAARAKLLLPSDQSVLVPCLHHAVTTLGKLGSLRFFAQLRVV